MHRKTFSIDGEPPKCMFQISDDSFSLVTGKGEQAKTSGIIPLIPFPPPSLPIESHPHVLVMMLLDGVGERRVVGLSRCFVEGAKKKKKGFSHAP